MAGMMMGMFINAMENLVKILERDLENTPCKGEAEEEIKKALKKLRKKVKKRTKKMRKILEGELALDMPVKLVTLQQEIEESDDKFRTKMTKLYKKYGNSKKCRKFFNNYIDVE